MVVLDEAVGDAELGLDVVAEQIEGLESPRDLDRIVGTGYGRVSVPFAAENISSSVASSFP